MKTYSVMISVCDYGFTVEADSAEEARDLAEGRLENLEFVAFDEGFSAPLSGYITDIDLIEEDE